MNRKKQRRASRTYSNVALDVYDPASQAIIGEARFVNVSLTGSLVESRSPFQVRQQIRLQVQSPSPASVEFSGKVMWKKKKADVYTYGIRFESLPTPVLTTPFSGMFYSQTSH